jgi:uncharacterized protein
MPKQTGLMSFPCRFPIKIIGDRHADFLITITEVIRINVPDIKADDITLRQSVSGKFYAITVTVTATSRQQLDNIYCSLSGHALVKMVL